MFLPGATEELIITINFAVRKTAHIAEYGLMAVLIFSVFAVDMTRWRRVWSIYTLVICGLIAAADEYRQMFSQVRTGAAKDLMLDLTGAVLFLVLLKIVFRDRYDASGKNLKSA